MISFASIPVSGNVKWIKQPPDLIHPGTGRPNLESGCVVRFNFAEQSDIAPILNTISGFGFEGLTASVLSKETDLGIRTLPFKGGLNNQHLIEDNKYKRLEIQIVNYQLWPFFDWMPSVVNSGDSFPAEAIGSVVNVRVKPRNPRDDVVEIVSIKLDSPVTGKTQRTPAAREAIFETPRSGTAVPPYQGSELRPNLNECPLQFEPGPHQGGWLQFIVLDEGLEGRTVTLSFIDTVGVEHKQSLGPLVVSKL